jgi:hypothetical protein
MFLLQMLPINRHISPLFPGGIVEFREQKQKDVSVCLSRPGLNTLLYY